MVLGCFRKSTLGCNLITCSVLCVNILLPNTGFTCHGQAEYRSRTMVSRIIPEPLLFGYRQVRAATEGESKPEDRWCLNLASCHPLGILSMMAEIVLATLNAKYIHASFGLRYLMANLGDLQSRAVLAEFEVNQKPIEIVEVLMAQVPKIVGFGVYIWNVTQTTEVVAILKRLRPDVIVILGGPEVSYETENQAIVQLADYVVTGEADLAFSGLCQDLLSGCRPNVKVIAADLPDLSRVKMPYALYSDEDVSHRVIYVEASRGCPFTCEFCLSSLEVPVRQFPLEALLEALSQLLDRGVRQFKFVDRTFNLNLNSSRTILEFFLKRMSPGLFVHFEMIPDRLPEGLREIIAKFPPGSLQFEVGVQTFNEEVARNISRRQDYARLDENFRFLRECTGVHIHADLIAGLPGESMESFGAGFDRLVRLGPQEIQVGILKRLRGTPIIRHDAGWEMTYSPQPPYEILRNKLLSFADLQALRRFARYWDLLGNSGNFVETVPLVWLDAESPWRRFSDLCDWLYRRAGRQHSIALNFLAESLFDYLAGERGLGRERVARSIWADFQRCGRHEVPEFLREFVSLEETKAARVRSLGPKRQLRHLAVATPDSSEKNG
jgi:radical SAM superfamily enzyme YgiQ (UPF0313 family)